MRSLLAQCAAETEGFSVGAVSSFTFWRIATRRMARSNVFLTRWVRLALGWIGPPTESITDSGLLSS
jgi:hypothetical protein